MLSKQDFICLSRTGDTVNVTSIWKVIKIRAEHVYGKEASEEQELAIGVIGIFNENISNIFQVRVTCPHIQRTVHF